MDRRGPAGKDAFMIEKSLLTLLSAVFLVYLGLCGWVYTKQRELMYFPQVTRVDAAATDFILTRGDVILRGWSANPGQLRALIYFGGNAERIEAMRDTLAHWFPDRSIYLVAYRGFGASPGQPDEATLFADALALFDDVAARHPGQPIAVVGRSLGSGVASYVAGHRPVERLALVTPFDSMRATAQAHYRWLPTAWLIKDRYESIGYLHRYRGPVLVIRATDDDIIPPVNTQRLIDSLNPPPRVVDLPGANHHNIGDYPAYGQGLRKFIEGGPPA